MLHNDWDALTHQWKITDLASRVNPYRASIAKRSASLGGDVHFKLAQMFENGIFDEVDLPSAVFHMECAGLFCSMIGLFCSIIGLFLGLF